ncbi:MAG: hypothetical protein K5697_00310 [Lachnospiraceae bacterium]|nr:hypothetical protein [Lachnospiraceae bacterium]
MRGSEATGQKNLYLSDDGYYSFRFNGQKVTVDVAAENVTWWDPMIAEYLKD